MTPQRFREIRGVFDSIVLQSPAEQAYCLHALAARDSELAREVQALLAAHQRRGNFIESPAALVSDTAVTAPEVTGTQVMTKWAGPYQLLDRIGEGGMGEVWRAGQVSPVRRIVAVKLVRLGMGTREVVSRFESERQALALMEHDAIARVFDAGTTVDGRPYFAMEYVAGVPITIYCDRSKLTVRERLKLFIRVCEGVQHAHQKAIIHRDLKPSNILVLEADGKAMPKIIDFGVARAMSTGDHDVTALTRLGVVIGTPDYMSPEQAAGGSEVIDTRADVYSLGVVLYELLAGARPLELRGLSFPQILQRIRESEAPRPSTRLRMLDTDSAAPHNRRSERAALISQLRGDLDAIALKALEKQRRLRYNSPAELAADIGRYLRFEPVTARPASAVYFARKYLRRHLAAVLVAATLLAMIVSFGFWQAAELRRITRERDRADRIAAFMTGMFRVADPSESRGNQVTARQILDRASADIRTGLASDPEMQAQLMNMMGRVYMGLGLYPQAESLLRISLNTRRRVLGPHHLDTAQAMNDLGNVLTLMGRYAEVRQIDQEVLAIRRSQVGEGHPDTLRSMNNLAVDLVEEGRYEEAEHLQRTVLEAKVRLMGPDHKSTLLAMSNLGDTLSKQGKYNAAEKIQRQSLNVHRRVFGSDHPDTMRTSDQLAATLYDEGRYAEAEELDREVLNARTRVLGHDHRDTLNSMIALANPLENEGRLAEAEHLDRTALEVQLRVLGPEHPDLLLAKNNLAGILAGEGRYAEAEKLDREVLAIRTRVNGPEHPRTLMSKDRLAFVLLLKGSFKEAERLARETREAQLKVFRPEHPELANSTYTLACVAANTSRSAEALIMLRDAVDHGLKPNAALGLSTDPALKPLRADPGFQDLVLYARRHAEVSLQAP